MKAALDNAISPGPRAVAIPGRGACDRVSRRWSRRKWLAFAGLLPCLLHASPQDTASLAPVTVVATPIGAWLPLWQTPYTVQTFTADDLTRSQALDATDYMNGHLAGITLNAAQGNPLQPDLQYRGFTASPLLGIAQGMAVYVDGVRANEVFGDTVNWDLIPAQAIARTTLVSGSDPVFGLNTLGGAISVTTKQGFDATGSRIQYQQGSWGRRQAVFESGGHNDSFGYYVTADHLREDGWRDQSPTRATHLLANLSWRGEHGGIDVGLLGARTDLVGNGSLPVQELARDYRAIFTAPDETANRLKQASVRGSWQPDDDVWLSAHLYSRRVRTLSYNGDVADDEPCDDDAAILCDDDEPVLDQSGQPIASRYEAIGNRGVRRQRANGGSAQLVLRQPWFGLPNQFTAGVELQDGRVGYAATVTAGVLLPDRSVSGDSGITMPAVALDVSSYTRNRGVYLTDTLSLADSLALTLSARYNTTHTVIADRSGIQPDLDGDHRFSRLNPAVGLAWRTSASTSVYASYSESARAPTPVELTCADPDAPCKLPNQFLADPPLHQVVARNWEAGVRGGLFDNAHLHWQADVFRTVNGDDILFQTTGGATANEGFFANVGATRRQGLELSAHGDALDGRLQAFIAYTLLDATYRTDFAELSASHPEADVEGRIDVRKGDRLPGLPRQSLKLGADYALTRVFSLGAAVVCNDGQYLRGDETNRLGKTAGYALVNLHARWQATARLSVQARVDNVFDRRYASFGTLGEADEVFPADEDPRFLGPGAPRGAWLGVALEL